MLNEARDDLLSSPQLATWINYMKLFNKENRKRQTSLIAVMTGNYGDEGVLKILETAKKTPGTTDTAKRLEAEQIQLWLKDGKSTDAVFKLLKLNHAGDNLLSSPQFGIWTKFMNYFYKENPDKRTTLIATLTTYFGDEGVLKMIEAAKKIKTVKTAATQLQAEHFQLWLGKRKDPSSVFKLLGLSPFNRATGDNLLETPHFTLWIKYTDDFYTKNPGVKGTSIGTLRNFYNDRFLVKTIIEAKAENTRAITNRIENELLSSWMVELNAPDDVLKLLSLDKMADNLLATPQLNTLTKYVNAFSTANPDKKTSLVATLTAHYGDEGLSAMFLAAKRIPSTENIATKLQIEQLQRWLSADKEPTTVFKLLKLNKAGDELLVSPQFSSWVKYTDDFNTKNHENKMTTIVTLRDHYDDKIVANMIIAAKKVPSRQTIAKKVEDDLFKSWTTTLNTPDDVFKLLKLDNAGNKLLESPVFKIYAKFMDDYNKANLGKEATMISALTKSYNDEDLSKILESAKKVRSTENIATKLQLDQIQYWLAYEHSPDRVFMLLKLHDSVDGLLTNPLVSTWAKYMNAFNAKYPSKKTSMIDTLSTNFGKIILANARCGEE